MNTRIRRCWSLDKAGEAEFARANAVARRADRPRQPAARRRRHPGRAAPLPPDRRVPLCRPGLRAARRDAGRPARHAQSSTAIIENFYQRPQAGLRPCLPRPVLRDRHAARGGDGRGRDADAAEAGQRGGRTNPGEAVLYAGARCSTTARRCETPRYRRDKLLGRRPGHRACADRSAQFDHHRPAGLCRDRHGLWRHADPPRQGAAGHGQQRSTPSACRSSAARCIRSPSRWATCSTG